MSNGPEFSAHTEAGRPRARARLRLVGADTTQSVAPRRVVVAIPVRNEVERIAGCLRALAGQSRVLPDRVVLLLNGCIDGTQAVVNAIVPSLALNVDIVERDLRGEDATAGMARSLAVAEAASGLDDNDVIMTTDADGAVARDWLALNLASIDHGADIVCGRAVIDWVEALLIPSHLHDDDARECALGALLDELASLVDPDPYDPWPRHSENSGASLAFSVAAWRRAGGIPTVPSGEDRAFVDRMRRIDARIRHAPDVQVTVSGRTFGRAAGGMADTIARRIVAQDEFVDSTIEPTANRYRRVSLRAQARLAWSGACQYQQALIESLGVAPDIVHRALAAPSFGQAWAILERDCPVLLAHRVRFADLAAEIAAAQALLGSIRDRQACPAPAQLSA